MSELENVLAELDDRAKEGKTASKIIEAARMTVGTRDEHVRVLESNIVEASATIEQLRTSLAEQADEVTALKTPRRSTKIDGASVEYTYRPATVDADGYSVSKWRLDEIESALMHLRLAGASDDTIVRADVLRATVGDIDQPVTGWINPRTNRAEWLPEFDEKGLKRIKWMRSRTWIIVGFIGFTLGGWVGMGVGGGFI